MPAMGWGSVQRSHLEQATFRSLFSTQNTASGLLKTGLIMDYASGNLYSPRKVNMSTRCLLVFANELMFVAVMSLLKSQPDLELVGVSAPNEKELFQAIDFYKPDILILDESNSPDQSTRPLHPLLHYPELRVITLNHEDNLLHIYQKRDVMVTRITDLVSVIHET
jgi:hypothetical protein